MNKYLIEFLGTMFFVYVILASRHPLAIGLALTLAIMIGGHISGGNYNPAVSVMMTAVGKLPVHDLLPYIVSQVAGALAALELYKRVQRRM
jgi:aquaporin Z